MDYEDRGYDDSEAAAEDRWEAEHFTWNDRFMVALRGPAGTKLAVELVGIVRDNQAGNSTAYTPILAEMQADSALAAAVAVELAAMLHSTLCADDLEDRVLTKWALRAASELT